MKGHRMGHMGHVGSDDSFDSNIKIGNTQAVLAGNKFNVGIFVLVLGYSVAFFFFTFAFILVRRRLQTFIRVPTVLLYILMYLANIFVIRFCFGYHVVYQFMTSAAMGLALVKFKNLNVIGLTGGIGCGKSSLSAMLENKLDAKILDCDKIVHQLQEPGQKCYKTIVQEFGEDILDDSKKIDRTKLREIVYKNVMKKRKLEKIVHPAVFWEIITRIFWIFWSSLNHFAVVDAPLLYESGILKYICYPIVVVYISDSIVWIDRITSRDKCSEEQARLVISNQMNIQTKVAMSEIAIDNSTTTDAMLTKFGEMFMKYITL